MIQSEVTRVRPRNVNVPSWHARRQCSTRYIYVVWNLSWVAHFSTALTARSSKNARLAARPTHERQPGEHEVQTIFGASPEADFLIDRGNLPVFPILIFHFSRRWRRDTNTDDLSSHAWRRLTNGWFHSRYSGWASVLHLFRLYRGIWNILIRVSRLY